MSKSRLRLGTRASALARWQAEWVAKRLVALGIEVELVPITTRGDANTQEAIGKIGSPGVFTKEIQRALLDYRIDLAVHSLKDWPTDPVEGLVIAAVPERENPQDVLVSRKGTLHELPEGAAVGTESLRRRAQLLHVRPDLQMLPIRGNVDTRLAKLTDGDFDALVLARAGLVRLGLEQHITQEFTAEIMLPAVGQGALAVEARGNDDSTLGAVSPLDHAPTHCAVLAERSLLAQLNGGCLAPVGAWAKSRADGSLHLEAAVLSLDGVQRLAADGLSAEADAIALGAEVAGRLLDAGADQLIEAARRGQ